MGKNQVPRRKAVGYDFFFFFPLKARAAVFQFIMRPSSEGIHHIVTPLLFFFFLSKKRARVCVCVRWGRNKAAVQSTLYKIGAVSRSQCGTKAGGLVAQLGVKAAQL